MYLLTRVNLQDTQRILQGEIDALRSSIFHICMNKCTFWHVWVCRTPNGSCKARSMPYAQASSTLRLPPSWRPKSAGTVWFHYINSSVFPHNLACCIWVFAVSKGGLKAARGCTFHIGALLLKKKRNSKVRRHCCSTLLKRYMFHVSKVHRYCCSTLLKRYMFHVSKVHRHSCSTLLKRCMFHVEVAAQLHALKPGVCSFGSAIPAFVACT